VNPVAKSTSKALAKAAKRLPTTIKKATTTMKKIKTGAKEGKGGHPPLSADRCEYQGAR
jgi:hypothetical protein